MSNDANSTQESPNQQREAKPPILWLPTSIFVLTFAVAAIGVPWYGFTEGFHWSAWLGFVLVLGANGMSITAGYHRLWAHNAYKAHPIMKVGYALFGAAATQNSILKWASDHRRHHRHVDDIEKDPYSAKRGLWFSHMGWMIRDYDNSREDFSNAPDLLRDKIVMWQHNNYGVLVLVMNFAPALLLGAITGDWIANILLAGVLRLVVSHHSTFFINSLAHFWGRQPYTEENTARDNDVLALFTYGEGYHNYHHLFQNDYRNGIRWWHFDPTKWLIKTASWLGLTWDLNKVSDFKIQRAITAMQFRKAQRELEAKASSGLIDTSKMAAFLEREYEEFRQCLNDWNELSQEWYGEKREAFVGKKHAMQEKWRQASVHTRIKELEYALKMQRKRLQLFTLQMA